MPNAAPTCRLSRGSIPVSHPPVGQGPRPDRRPTAHPACPPPEEGPRRTCPALERPSCQGLLDNCHARRLRPGSLPPSPALCSPAHPRVKASALTLARFPRTRGLGPSLTFASVRHLVAPALRLVPSVLNTEHSQRHGQYCREPGHHSFLRSWFKDLAHDLVAEK
jgi:hypothetical protein